MKRFVWLCMAAVCIIGCAYLPFDEPSAPQLLTATKEPPLVAVPQNGTPTPIPAQTQSFRVLPSPLPPTPTPTATVNRSIANITVVPMATERPALQATRVAFAEGISSVIFVGDVAANSRVSYRFRAQSAQEMRVTVKSPNSDVRLAIETATAIRFWGRMGIRPNGTVFCQLPAITSSAPLGANRAAAMKFLLRFCRLANRR